MPASSVAATCGDSELEGWEEVTIATPDDAAVSPAAEVQQGGARPREPAQAARPHGPDCPRQRQGTGSDLPSSEDSQVNEPSTKRLCYTLLPIWQVGIDWTGFSKSRVNK